MSPELFFEQNDRELTTRPMKGTTQRGVTDQEDLEQASWLEQDPKNRSENMMIVDLLRNDMNRISEVGSEHVGASCVKWSSIRPFGSMTFQPSRVSYDRMLS